MSNLYPPIEPFATHNFSVSDLHTIYVEQCGNPNGQPILFIHGGPGGGTDPIHRCFFNPEYYHIILVDQRGCGKSTPFAELCDNNTANLITDFELIRQKLDISQWILFGGSWGSTLALAYAQAHPQSVSTLILRGIYLASERQSQWLFGGHGANYIFPDYWEPFRDHIAPDKRNNMLQAYYELLTNEDESIRVAAATLWSQWEISISTLQYNPEAVTEFNSNPRGVSMATLECHYMLNQCFLEPEQLINNMHKIAHIPGYIVHGRYDMVCTAASAWQLHQAWPQSQLHYVTHAGHSLTDPDLATALVAITDQLATNPTLT